MADPQEVTATELVALVEPHLAGALVAFDIDGVLAPLVEHADESELTNGVAASLDRLAVDTRVAIVSGRSLDSIERLFRFPPGLHVVGSHGLEVRGAGPMELDDDERYRLDQVDILGRRAVEAAGDGAWLERKPASVALHTRRADAASSGEAVAALTNLASMIEGVQIKHGHHVVELLARTASKGTALSDYQRRIDGAPLVFFGDDLTDEDVFRVMSDDEISVRVGPGETAARFRLDNTDSVAEFLRGITAHRPAG